VFNHSHAIHSFVLSIPIFLFSIQTFSASEATVRSVTTRKPPSITIRVADKSGLRGEEETKGEIETAEDTEDAEDTKQPMALERGLKKQAEVSEATNIPRSLAKRFAGMEHSEKLLREKGYYIEGDRFEIQPNDICIAANRTTSPFTLWPTGKPKKLHRIDRRTKRYFLGSATKDKDGNPSHSHINAFKKKEIFKRFNGYAKFKDGWVEKLIKTRDLVYLNRWNWRWCYARQWAATVHGIYVRPRTNLFGRTTSPEVKVLITLNDCTMKEFKLVSLSSIHYISSPPPKKPKKRRPHRSRPPLVARETEELRRHHRSQLPLVAWETEEPRRTHRSHNLHRYRTRKNMGTIEEEF
jgi:hypothetical protein